MINSGTVLIFEDKEKLVQIYITELEKINLQLSIRVVNDLNAFIQDIKEYKPHLIVLGSSVPGFGEVLLGLHRHLQIIYPVIVMGSRESESDFRESISHGAYEFISVETAYRLSNSAKNALEFEILRRQSSRKL